jgi:signal transduction histidine kinase
MTTMRSWPADRRGAARRWAVDAVVAAAVAALQAGAAYAWGGHAGGAHAAAMHHGGQVIPAAIVLAAAGGAVLVARRRFPVAVLAVTLAVDSAFVAMAGPTGIADWLGSTVAFCTAIYLRKRAAALGFLAACYASALWAPMLAGQRAPTAAFATALGIGLAFLIAVAELIRLWRQRAAAIEQRRVEEVLRHASEERLRIARDLHDVVAHNISVINVQASTALHLMDRQPERARSALVTINEVSKQALVEVRSVLGVLRGVDEPAPREPSSTLDRLGDLVENATAAGLTVRVEQAGEGPPLPAGVDLAAYRIVQEALTNSARHSGGTGAMVRISRDDRDLIIEVDDDGPGKPGARGCGDGMNGSGNGIIGMTERAHALGGTLEAAPRPDGGFRVRARLPLKGEMP